MACTCCNSVVVDSDGCQVCGHPGHCRKHRPLPSEEELLADVDNALALSQQPIGPITYKDLQRATSRLCKKNPHTSDMFHTPPHTIVAEPLDEVLNDVIRRVVALERGMAKSIREALHHADQGDVPAVRRILRNALEEILQSPDPEV